MRVPGDGIPGTAGTRVFGDHWAVNAEGAAHAKLVARKPVPLAQLVGRHAKVVGDREYRVALANLVDRRVLGVGGAGEVGRIALARGHRNDDLGVALNLAALKIVDLGDGAGGGVVLAGDLGQRLTGFHLVIAPPDAHVLGNDGNGLLKLLAGAGRQPQDEIAVLGSGHAEETGVEVLQGGNAGVHALGDETEVN